jgi:hypothetical protein
MGFVISLILNFEEPKLARNPKPEYRNPKQIENSNQLYLKFPLTLPLFPDWGEGKGEGAKC